MASTDTSALRTETSQASIPLWRDERVLRWAAQIISAVVIVSALAWSYQNIITAANARGLGLGFGFLDDSAGFAISDSPIPYDPSMSFARALWVGILNTLRVSLVGIFIATILGFIVGIAQLSSNWLVSKIALAFVEIHRNIPLLVLLFLWYRGVFTKLPAVRDSIAWPGPVYINQRGVYMPAIHLTDTGIYFAVSLVLGVFGAVGSWVWLQKIRAETGRVTYPGLTAVVFLIGIPLIGWLLSGGSPFVLEYPELRGFNYRGGMPLSPEFTALLIGLSTYTAAFIAEIVRAGIQAVSRGQIEAARALGLRELRLLNLIVIPQALRIIIPPLISQYLNLTKNSSLAVFLGFPELFSIGKTVINQAGRAVPVFVFIMASYLVISLVTSFVLNIYNRRVQFLEK